MRIEADVDLTNADLGEVRIMVIFSSCKIMQGGRLDWADFSIKLTYICTH